MLDIGWAEMAVIAVIALIVIGPRELPRALYILGRWAGKARGLLRDLQQGMDEIAREAELEDMKKKFDSARKLDVKREIGAAIDPDGQIARAFDPTANSDGIVPRSAPELEEDEDHDAVPRTPAALRPGAAAERIDETPSGAAVPKVAREAAPEPGAAPSRSPEADTPDRPATRP